MIVVTGMHRSGASLVTGLLSQCDYNLGTSPSVIDKPMDNIEKEQCGNCDALAINDAIIKGAGGSWSVVPSIQEITVSGIKQSFKIKEFSRKFDGNLFEDPNVSLTIPLWEKYCSNLTTIIFCLRNPLGVAFSLKAKTGMTLEHGLQLWYSYNLRLINGPTKLPVIVVDFDNMRNDYLFEIEYLLDELGTPMSTYDIQKRIGNYSKISKEYDSSIDPLMKKLPKEILKLYNIILSQTFTYRFTNVAV